MEGVHRVDRWHVKYVYGGSGIDIFVVDEVAEDDSY